MSPNTGCSLISYQELNNEKRICLVIDITVQAEYEGIMLVSEMLEICQDLSAEPKYSGNMKVRVVCVILGALGYASKA